MGLSVRGGHPGGAAHGTPHPDRHPAVARDIKEPKIEVRKLFDIVRDDVWRSTRQQQQPFTHGSLPGREDFYFVAGK
jgi:hypothetical protein